MLRMLKGGSLRPFYATEKLTSDCYQLPHAQVWNYLHSVCKCLGRHYLRREGVKQNPACKMLAHTDVLAPEEKLQWQLDLAIDNGAANHQN